MSDETPLMKQYWELKSQVPDALLLFRMGDFYELFGDDAVLAAQILEITLTSRDKNKPNPMPMAGVPHHSVQGYIQKLLKAGKKIAIGEQIEGELEPAPKGALKSAPKIVKREIVRVLTPAVQFDAEGFEANYLATAIRTPEKKWFLSCLEPSTGEALISDALDDTSLVEEIKRLPIRHFLNFATIADSILDEPFTFSDSILVENLPKNYISIEKSREILRRHYEMEHLETFIPHESGILALGTLVLYTLRTQIQDRLAHLQLPEPLQKPKSVILGPNTAQHLDLGDLFQLINQTKSTLGARQLKRWLLAPLKSAEEISNRQKGIQELASQTVCVTQVSSELSKIYDLERICGRVNTRLANPRDTFALGQSLAAIENLIPLLSGLQSEIWIQFRKRMTEVSQVLRPLAEKILRTQKEEAPLTAKDGGIFKMGTTPDLDRLISLTEDGQRWLVELETREKNQTGISSLKVRYNRVFGYYIEVTQTHLKNVPAHYQRKQTMVGAERFFTEELKKFEEEILTAAVKQKSMEQELFNGLLNEIVLLTSPIMEAARVIGDLDALASLSHLLEIPGWCLPEILSESNASLEMSIQSGRHPLVDQFKRGSFVPNDVLLHPQTRLTLLITGPNMGGKSTVMRQVALIVILGQMGAPIPAAQAKWGVVSSIYTRIGAQDAIAKGQSTFMVEMSELAHILHHADERSLIILDEIGRGTSTYDGMSVAWATLEWICNRIQARTLFATHYHELIRLSATLPRLANAHMAVEGGKKSKDKAANSLRFLYELREGPTNESFGIHVAQLAGLPKAVVSRAWKILAELENSSNKSSEDFSEKSIDMLRQLSLFNHSSQNDVPEECQKEVEILEPHPVVQELEKLDLNELTPLQALNFVAKLQGIAKSSTLTAS